MAVAQLDRISAEARALRPGRALLSIPAGALYSFGFAAAVAVSVIALAVAWCFVAARLGARDGWAVPRR